MKWIVLCCAALITGVQPMGAPQSLPILASEWGAANAGLRLAISPITTADGRPDEREFYVAIENVGDSDVVVNLGYMLANGKVMFPEAVRLVLTDAQGTSRDLYYFDRRYPVIAGRVDDFIVALRAGSVYALRAPLARYWSPATKEFGLKLAHGQYQIEARFNGHGATSINLDTPGIALLNFWKGALRSNSVVFEVP